jgi:O-antigen ligase
MYSSIAALSLLGIALAWTALNKSGIPPFDWYVSLLLIGIASLTFWSRPRRLLSPALPPWLLWTIRGWLLYLIFQVTPLPLPLLSLLSPQRAALTRALAPVSPQAFAPIAVDPAAHWLWFLTLAGSAAAFFLLRDVTFRLQNRLIIAILPLFAVAGFEALLGLFQIAGGAPEAIGSYNSRDHYCCILELTLPLTIAFGLLFWQRRHESGSIGPVFQAMACWMTSGLLTLGILFSLSRAGWIDSVWALLVLLSLLLFPRVPSLSLRLGLIGGFLLLVFAIFLFASPGAMLNRLVGTLTPDAEGRIYIWHELLPLLTHFRWFGTGLMGFDPVFLKFQAIVNAKRIDFAHNDFLQYLIELGLIGFVPLLVSLIAVVQPIARGSWQSPVRSAGAAPEVRLLLVGCVAGLAALFVHSLVDFNLYVPANVLSFAWLLGFGSALAGLITKIPADQ